MSETRHFFRQGGQFKQAKDLIHDRMYQYVRQARGLDLFPMPDIDTETQSDLLLKKHPLNEKDNHQMKDVVIIYDVYFI